MPANRLLVLVTLGAAAAVLSFGTSCSTGEPGGGSSGGEVSAAVHGLKCNDTYCDCAGLNGGEPWPGMTEKDCRDLYCEGGPNYYGGDVKCRYDPEPGPTPVCDEAAYCHCVDWGGTDWECRSKHCPDHTAPIKCSVDPNDPCDPGYCPCVEQGTPEPQCRAQHCTGEPLSRCLPITCVDETGDTGWKWGSKLYSTSSWKNASLLSLRRPDNKYAISQRTLQCPSGGGETVGPQTFTTNHLDLRNFDIAIPAGTVLTGIQARVKQTGGTLIETVIFVPGGRTRNLGNGWTQNGYHHFGGLNHLFGKSLTAADTLKRGLWGLSLRAQFTVPQGQCPQTAGSAVDTIQFRAHYKKVMCD